MAQFPGIPWDQRPDYVALTQRVDPAGIVTAYSKNRGCSKQTELLTIIKILLVQVSLPPMSHLSCLGKQHSQSTFSSSTVADSLRQPSNNNTKQLARGHVLPESDARMDSLST